MRTLSAISGKTAKRRTAISACFKAASVVSLSLLANFSSADGFCPEMSEKGVISNLSFMPAFVHVDDYSGGKGLTISSFLSANRNPAPATGFTKFQKDLVARIPNINSVNYNTFNPATGVEILTDLDLVSGFVGRTIWPNDAERVPTGILPFEGLIIPQGFLSAEKAGRLSIVNLSSPTKQEYIVHQSPETVSSRAYHNVIWADMDNDGLKDIVTVRSGFRVSPTFQVPRGEVVWFKNPGNAISPLIPWQERMIFRGLAANGTPSTNGTTGPDINIAAEDLDGDGSIEIFVTSFFTGGYSNGDGKITLLGKPLGGNWSQVNVLAVPAVMPRVKEISKDQGLPFGLQIVDLNNDGRKDILATNHAPDNCEEFLSNIPGRVYALEQPFDGQLFTSPWITHILKDNIRPQPSYPGSVSPGRLAPGRAIAFYPVKYLDGIVRPSIVVGGDQAGKVWMLQPQNPFDSTDWNYDSAVIFDINAYYGENTTQERIPEGEIGAGRENSTIGGIAVAYNRPGLYGVADIYIPVYEGRAIHVLSYATKENLITCTEDVNFACPVAPVE